MPDRRCCPRAAACSCDHQSALHVRSEVREGPIVSINLAARKMLWGRARNQCAYPSCTQELIHELADVGNTGDVATPIVLGEEAHIRSGKVDGPRYDADYPPELVDLYNNLILLCGTHHTLVDKECGRGYSVQDLIMMKQRHEHGAVREERLERVSPARPIRD